MCQLNSPVASYGISTKYTGPVLLETMFSLHSLTYPLNKIQFMTNIKRLLFQHQDAPSSGSFQEQWNTNQTCQSRYWSPSLVSLKYLMIPVRTISTWLETCIVLFSYTPWGWHLSAKTCRSLIHATNCILWHVFDWVHSLVDMVNVTICVVWVFIFPTKTSIRTSLNFLWIYVCTSYTIPWAYAEIEHKVAYCCCPC